MKEVTRIDFEMCCYRTLDIVIYIYIYIYNNIYIYILLLITNYAYKR